MATRIPTAPTPEQFAKRETRLFAAAIRELAGRDGRLSANEASHASIKLAGALRVAIDNIENYFAATGHDRPRLTSMVRKHYEYAYGAAKAAADPDGKLSSPDAIARLPEDLRDNFYLRRGLLPPSN